MIVVVAALALREDRLLIAQRPDGSHLAGRWEFPGGKLEADELPERALERELREELGVESETGRIYQAIPYRYPGKDVLLLFYLTRITRGEPQPIEEAAVRWVREDELGLFDFAPVDALLVERLRRDGFQRLVTIQS